MITAIIAGGLVSVWFWTVLNDEEGILKHLNRLLEKNRVTKKWMICPWCSGAWFALIPTIAIYHPSILLALVAGFAAAAVAGLIGSYLKG